MRTSPLGPVGGAAELFPDTPDRVLVTKFALERDDYAFELLVRRHGRLVQDCCRRVLPDPHAADDAFQATFLALARSAPKLAECQSLGGWLHRVAVRASLDVRRQSPRTLPLRHDPAGAGDPGARAESREANAILDEAVNRLPEVYRHAFVLCELEGLTQPAAALALDCPVGTVASRVGRAKQRLRKSLARRGVTGLPAALAGGASVSTTARATAVAWAAGRALPTARVSRLAAHATAAGVAGWQLAGATLLATAMTLGGVWGVGEWNRPAPGPPATPVVAARAAESDDEPLPEDAVRRFGSPRLRHGRSVRAVAFSPDGQRIVSVDSSPEGELCVWDGVTGKRVMRSPCPTGAVGFSPDGKTVYAVVEDGLREDGLRSIDVASGAGKTVPLPTTEKTALAVGAEGKFDFNKFAFGRAGDALAYDCRAVGEIVVADPRDHSVRWTWQYKSDDAEGKLPIVDSHSLGYGADGKTLYVSTTGFDRDDGSEAHFVQWFSPDGQPLGRVRVPMPIDDDGPLLERDLLRGEGVVSGLTATADGAVIYAMLHDGDNSHNFYHLNGYVLAIDAKTGRRLWRTPIRLHFRNTPVVVPGGVAVMNGLNLSVLKAADGSVVSNRPIDALTLSPPSHDILGLNCPFAVRPDGKAALVGEGCGTVTPHALAAGVQALASPSPTYAVGVVRFTADGKRLLGWSDTWYAWDVAAGAQTTLKPRATLTEEFNGLGISTVTNFFKFHSADGATILTADPVSVVGVNPQFGDPMASLDLQLYNTATGQVVASRTLKGWTSVGGVGNSPGGRSVVLDGYWAADKAERLVVTSVDANVPDIVLEQKGRQWGNTPFVYTGDGRRIATIIYPADVNGQPTGRCRVHVWDATTGKLFREFTPDPLGDVNNHTQTVMSHDGQWLAAFTAAHQTSADKPEPTWVEMWDLDTGVKSKTISLDAGNRLFAFDPTGRQFAVSAGDAVVKVYDAGTGRLTRTIRHGDRASVLSVAFAPDGKTLATAGAPSPVLLWRLDE